MLKQLIKTTILITALFLFAPSAASAFSFGDNGGTYTNDGECDDPRFGGRGMASSLDYANIGHDAVDCEYLYYQDDIYFEQDLELFEDEDAQSDDFYDVEWEESDFGNNNSNYAFNGECDDPRFSGWGMADVLVDGDSGKDSFDCYNLFLDGDIDWN